MITEPVISGVMPQWQKRFHRTAGAVMCLLFVAFGFLTARPLFRTVPAVPGKTLLIASVLYLAAAAVGIGMQLWFQRRIISEFLFDGRSFRYRTLGVSTFETRALSEIAAIRDWRGRSQPIGYKLLFRDGRKAYLQYCVSNSKVVAEQLRLHVAG